MSSLQAADFCFVALDPAGQAFELEIVPSDDRAKQYFQTVWQRMSGAVENFHKLSDSQPPGWAAWTPWKWCEDKRTDYAARQKYVAWSGPHLVGLLNVWADFPSIHQSGTSCLYIEHLAAAPGNLNTELWLRKFEHVGIALLAFSVLLSHQSGSGGRVALHVGDESVLNFYRRVSDKIGGSLFFPEQTGVTGPTPHGVHGDSERVYLEMTDEGATRLLEEYRRA